jgi:drug/metabolite transporter (DMT)-like permease
VLGTTRTTVYTYLQPIVAAVTAILFLGESFTLWLVVGAALVLIGLVLVKKA